MLSLLYTAAKLKNHASYLKNTVLKRLLYKGVVEKFHEKKPAKKVETSSSSKDARTKSTPTTSAKLAWLWRIKDTSSRPNAPSHENDAVPVAGSS